MTKVIIDTDAPRVVHNDAQMRGYAQKQAGIARGSGEALVGLMERNEGGQRVVYPAIAGCSDAQLANIQQQARAATAALHGTFIPVQTIRGAEPIASQCAPNQAPQGERQR